MHNLIISEEKDAFTDSVIYWLLSSNCNIIRINENSYKSFFSLNISSVFSEFSFNENCINKIWHRRSRFNFLDVNKICNKDVFSYLKKENDSLIKSIELYLKSHVDYVGSWFKETENYKIIQLLTAKESGLKIPDSLITNSKKELIEFYNKHKEIITKDIRYPVYISSSDAVYVSNGVLLVTMEMIDSLGDNFTPMFFQKKINKKFEIRTFFFKNDFYSMAIFSQENEKTKLDYWNYDDKKPNRCVPINLPNDIINKISLFNSNYGLNTGSIDFIYSVDNEYFFLEVNPQGQLEWLSRNCNYYIEKEVAKYFNHENKSE